MAIEIKDKEERALQRRGGSYNKTSEQVAIRLSTAQSAQIADFAINFGLRPTEVVRACIAACFGPENFLGPDDKIGVVQAATYLAEGEVGGE